MKKTTMALLSFILLASLFSSSCYEDDPKSKMAIRNTSGASITVQVGSQDYGTIANGETSGYKEFDVDKQYDIYVNNSYVISIEFDGEGKGLCTIDNATNSSGWTLTEL